MITVHTHPALSTPVPTDHPSRVTPPPQGTLRRLVGRVVFALAALVVTLLIGQGAASADEGDPDLTPQGPRATSFQCFEDGSCRKPGDRMLSRGQVTGIIRDLCQRQGPSGPACRVLAERDAGRSGADVRPDEGPSAVALSLDGVAPLAATVPDRSYTTPVATTGYGPNGLDLDAFLGR